MKAIRLITSADEYDSSPGFLMKGCPDFEGVMSDRDGTLTAHDVLEHQNGIVNMGPVWDELEASGGVWQVRGRHGDLMHKTPNIHPPAVHVASDVTRMFPEWDGRNGPHSMRTRPHDYDDDFRDILEIARHDILRELIEETKESSHGRQHLESYLGLALHRMRTGFRKAEKRFGSDFHGYSQFRAIRDAIGRAVNWIDWEGQEFVLLWGNGEASCNPVNEDWEY